MRVLITHQFNTAMAGLDTLQQREVFSLYSFIESADKEHVLASSLTHIMSENEDIYTLRGNDVRVFCTFTSEAGEDVIVFLDVKSVKSRGLSASHKPLSGEITLFGSRGDPVAYIADSSDKTIFSFNGEPLAYIDEKSNIYGFNGRHLGWYENEIIWDHNGNRVGFTKNTCPVLAQFEPFKGFKQFKPFRSFKQFAPFKPFKSINISNIGLLEFLKAGR